MRGKKEKTEKTEGGGGGGGGGGYPLDGGVSRAVYLDYSSSKRASLDARTKCNHASRKFLRNWITLVRRETKRRRGKRGEMRNKERKRRKKKIREMPFRRSEVVIRAKVVAGSRGRRRHRRRPSVCFSRSRGPSVRANERCSHLRPRSRRRGTQQPLYGGAVKRMRGQEDGRCGGGGKRCRGEG